MEAQEIFDTVVAHLRTQKVQALRADGGGCAYRGEGGTKCAIGCLVTDEEYDPTWDKGAGICASKLVELSKSFRERVIVDNEKPKEILSLLDRLQSIHDGGPVEDWERHLAMTAENWGLNLKPKES